MDRLFIVISLVFHIILITHFASRKWRFDFALRYGWVVYILSIPAAVVSLILLLSSKPWYLWLGGFLYLVWAAFGYTIEYKKHIEWRNPIYWPVFGPYITLYLATAMFYWWPAAQVYKPGWYVIAVLFVISTILNVSSHQSSK
jgi:hypothetical protein